MRQNSAQKLGKILIAIFFVAHNTRAFSEYYPGQPSTLTAQSVFQQAMLTPEGVSVQELFFEDSRFTYLILDIGKFLLGSETEEAHPSAYLSGAIAWGPAANSPLGIDISEGVVVSDGIVSIPFTRSGKEHRIQVTRTKTLADPRKGAEGWLGFGEYSVRAVTAGAGVLASDRGVSAEAREIGRMLEAGMDRMALKNNPDELARAFGHLAKVVPGSPEERAARDAVIRLSRKYVIWTDNLSAKMERVKSMLSAEERGALESFLESVRSGVKASRDEQWAVINAGGVGGRLWPIGYRTKPKQLMEFTKGQGTLLQMAVERQIDPDDPNALGPAHVMIVTNVEIEEKVWEQVEKYGIPRENVIAEPIGLDTGPALRLAALVIEKRAGPDAIIRSLSADHIIPDHVVFNRALQKSADLAKLTNVYVEVGVTPGKDRHGRWRVNPKFGHQVIGREIGDNIYFLMRRVKKEAGASSKRSGRYYRGLVKRGAKWNSDCVIVRAGVIDHMMMKFNPEFEDIFARYKDRLDDQEGLRGLYDELIEKSGKISKDDLFAVPGTEGRCYDIDTACSNGLDKDNWDDVGNLMEARRMNGVPKASNYIAQGDEEKITFGKRTSGNTVYATNDGTKVFLHTGVRNIIVAYEKATNSLLVLPAQNYSRAREVPRDIQAEGMTALLPYATGDGRVPERCGASEVRNDSAGNVCAGNAVFIKDSGDSSFFTDKGLLAAINLRGYTVTWDGETNEIHIYAASRPSMVKRMTKKRRHAAQGNNISPDKGAWEAAPDQREPADREEYSQMGKMEKEKGIEAKNVIAFLMALARQAKGDLIVGIETDWIPFYEAGTTQHNILNPLIAKITSLDKTLKDMGCGNVKIVYRSSGDLAGALSGTVKKNGSDLSDVIIFAACGTLSSKKFDEFRSEKDERRAFIASIDPSEIRGVGPGEIPAGEELDIPVMGMMSVALDMAASRESPDLSAIREKHDFDIKYEEDLRAVYFKPKRAFRLCDELRDRNMNEVRFFMKAA